MTEQKDLFGTSAGRQVVMPKNDRLIPFGKYKNQPYEVLVTDSQYAIWMLSSMYAKLEAQHPALLAYLAARYGNPENTPEHNRLQNRFLDTGFALKFAMTVCRRAQSIPRMLESISPATQWTQYVKKILEEEKARAERNKRYEKGDKFAEKRDQLLDIAERLAFVPSTGTYQARTWSNAVSISRLQFEYDGADVHYAVEVSGSIRAKVTDVDAVDDFYLTTYGELAGYRIEVKPLVGDDYPNILRAMKVVKVHYLLVGEYCGEGATWDEVVRIFGLSGITVVSLAAVEATVLPASFKEVEVVPMTKVEAQRIVQTTYDAIMNSCSLPNDKYV